MKYIQCFSLTVRLAGVMCGGLLFSNGSHPSLCTPEIINGNGDGGTDKAEGQMQFAGTSGGCNTKETGE